MVIAACDNIISLKFPMVLRWQNHSILHSRPETIREYPQSLLWLFEALSKAIRVGTSVEWRAWRFSNIFTISSRVPG